MAARTLDKMRKAQSLLRDCHSWLVQSNEMLLAVEMCNIEGSLALLFENRCFANTPCPGLQDEELPRLPPSNGYRRGTRRGPYNGGRRPYPTNRGGPEAPASRASGGQNARVQAGASTSGGTGSSNCPDDDLKPPAAQATTTGASPATGVLLDFTEDVEFVQLPPNMVVSMEAVQAVLLEPKGKQCLPEGPAAVSSDQPAPEGSVRVEGDARSIHQTIIPAADATLGGPDFFVDDYCTPMVEEGVVPVLPQPEISSSPACDSLECVLPNASQTYQRGHGITESRKGDASEEFPVLTSAEASTKDMLVDLDNDLAVILPGGTDADTDSTAHTEGKGVLADGFDSGVSLNLQLEDLEDDEIVFQGNAAKRICPDFKAVFVSSDDSPQTARRVIDLKTIFEKYFEVVICK
ncbi:uncharacterized protein N7479_007231 [Penicillium vulpinum]|uniref:Uncharacterized protein n=1 Tax=Penicillium vulpinum TaxID=29845 RepID=A0A1V6S0H1_9EURO|nr:uncharacterized protein N7479_007231 [Penicillium vulpinum]KAJ5960081.1 hypothetical protein N7479_007231 [Penicillium vulpinum]OQE07532.1 hypothetical protein PENVUL_c013G06044 [Penicillium vulpinum]